MTGGGLNTFGGGLAGGGGLGGCKTGLIISNDDSYRKSNSMTGCTN